MIVIVDYGMGNIKSIYNIINRLGYQCIITADPELISNSSFIILPGVGHFKAGIANIIQRNLVETLNNCALNKKTPMLGICLGMQLMTDFSQEGDVAGLGWIQAQTIKFPDVVNNKKLIIPNVGWRDVYQSSRHDILQQMPHDRCQFYFVHSYYVKLSEHAEQYNWLSSDYGFNYCCGFIKDNIMGVQFHPEKSHVYGMKFFSLILEKIYANTSYTSLTT